MNAVKNIYILTPGFPSEESDYSCMPYLQTYLRQIASSHADLKITVIALQYPFSSEPYSWLRIKVFPCSGNNRSFPMKLRYWRKALQLLDKGNEEKKIDVVHSLWLTECTYLAQRWTRLNNVKHVATAMGQDVLPTNRYLNRIDLGKMTTVAVSSFQNFELKKTVGSAADHLIPWGMNVETFIEKDRNIDILGVGSLTKLKDYGLFLKVIAMVVQANPNVNVALIGDGPERANLERLAKSLSISNNVQFMGMVSRPVVLETMKRSKVFLHSSSYESQGFVFNEAFANGMSIVSRKTGSAVASDRWLIGETESEMAQHVITLMDKEFPSESLMSVDQTIAQYKDLFSFD